MAILEHTFYSEILENTIDMIVIIPDKIIANNNNDKSKCLYFVVGMDGKSINAILHTKIYTYANANERVVIIISNTCFGHKNISQSSYRYYDFMKYELIDISRNLFNLSHDKKDTSIAGYSFGGYSAFILGLSCPDIFGIIGS